MAWSLTAFVAAPNRLLSVSHPENAHTGEHLPSTAFLVSLHMQYKLNFSLKPVTHPSRSVKKSNVA